MLAVKQLPASAIGPTSFTSAGQLTGYSALITILKGQPITSNLVSSQPDQLSIASSSYLPIPTGYVALTLPTNEQQGVSGYVAQGDYIDVIASVNTNLFAQSTQHVVTRTVFNRVRVIRVGPPSDSAKQGAALGLASSLTVVLSLCDAQYMQWLIINATLNYTLLSYHDYGPATFTPDASCPSTGMPSAVGPAQVDNRWGFTKV
jgi:Flp pilus assembly protein CpaB